MRFIGTLFEENSETRGKVEILGKNTQDPVQTYFFKSLDELKAILEKAYLHSA